MSKELPTRIPKQWTLVNLRKIRMAKEVSPENDKMGMHLDYMHLSDALPQILDWIQRSGQNIDIASYTPEQAMDASAEWHQAISGEGEGVIYEPTKSELIVYGPKWQNPKWQGWTIQKVMSKNDLLAEGNMMDHCVGSYCEDVTSERTIIYSLRDPQNNPHITIEVGGGNGGNIGSIEQIQGKSNSDPKDEYKAMIKEWISTSGDKAGIKTEVNTFESLDNEDLYNNPEITELNEALEKILQGESNEYGLKHVLDESIDDVIDRVVSAGESENNNYRGDSGYYGDVTISPSYIVNIALKEDLNLSRWPRHSQEYTDMISNNPKQTDWKNIREAEQWAWSAIDEITESFDYSETGLSHPQEEDYETTEEYDEAMQNLEIAEQEIYDEWIKQSVKGGVAKDILDELRDNRAEGVIPSPEELYKITKQEQKKLEEDAEKKQFSEIPTASSKNWYKIAQSNSLRTTTIDNVETGQPCIVQAYHGTPDGRFLPEFDPQKPGYYTDAPEYLADNNQEFVDTYGDIRQGFRDKSSTGHIGVSFTDSYQTAKSYSEKPAFDYRSSIPMIVQRYVKLENPKVIDLNGKEWKISVNDDIAVAMSEGHDSLVLKNIKDNYHPNTTSTPTNNLITFSTNNIMTSLEEPEENVNVVDEIEQPEVVIEEDSRIE